MGVNYGIIKQLRAILDRLDALPGVSGARRTLAFPFAFNSAGILTGHTLYVPTVGDILHDVWLEIDTAWDGTTPQGDLLIGGQFNWGWLHNAGQALDMTVPDGGTGDGLGLKTGGQLSSLKDALTLTWPTSNEGDGLYVVAGAAVNFIPTAVSGGTRYLPSKFAGVDPVQFVVSQDGTKTGADPVATQGSAILYLDISTPS